LNTISTLLNSFKRQFFKPISEECFEQRNTPHLLTSCLLLPTVLLRRMGHYTDAPKDNLLGLISKQALSEQEALGVATVERYLLEEVDYPVEFSVALVQDLHRRAFGNLYDWAGQWRRTVPNVGAYVPPAAGRVP
jgi:hypothetical protein